MSKTLIIDAGHGGTDNGTNGFGVLEKTWNLKMSLYQYKRLKELGANVHLTRDKDVSLSNTSRTNKIKSKFDYCMSNHFNGFNGEARGVETIHSIYGGKSEATKLANAITQTSGLPLRRVFTRKHPTIKGADYYFMHRLTGNTRTIIVEYAFMDNKKDNDYFKNETQFYEVAEAIVKAWCEILGVVYKKDGKKEAPKKDGGLYKVQVGAFGNKKNAEGLAIELAEKGYDTIIKKE